MGLEQVKALELQAGEHGECGWKQGEDVVMWLPEGCCHFPGGGDGDQG